MAYLLTALASLFLVVLAGVALLALLHLFTGRRVHYRVYDVHRRHFELSKSAQIDEKALEAARLRFMGFLERRRIDLVEASLKTGINYPAQILALSAIATNETCAILERQLLCRVTSDPVEQSWYWLELVRCLRRLGREQCLPHILRRFELAADGPLGHFLAAETISFRGFAYYLNHTNTPLGLTALRALHTALQGLRQGLQAQIFVDSRMGELIELVWDNRPENIHPLVVRIFLEAQRFLRRAPHAELSLARLVQQEKFQGQVSRLTALEPAFEDYLAESPGQLGAILERVHPFLQAEIFHALIDLRAEAASAVVPLFQDPCFTNRDLAVLVLTYSRDPRVGRWLLDWIAKCISPARRARDGRLALSPRRRSIPASFPYAAIITALRGHSSPETEAFLLLAARDWDPTFRAAATSSLGWWQPFNMSENITSLQDLRHDPNVKVRQAACAALARLGERQALQGFRHALSSDDSQRAHETVQLAAREGLILLWPDLDRLADADDQGLAHHACEALEQLREELYCRSAA